MGITGLASCGYGVDGKLEANVEKGNCRAPQRFGGSRSWRSY